MPHNFPWPPTDLNPPERHGPGQRERVPGPCPGPIAMRDVGRWPGNETCPLLDPARLKRAKDVVRGKVARAFKRPYTKRAA